jgi:redox-sensitive bicupin YhaK (pirin superfamily)
MLQIRRAADRGITKIDWLDSRHTFSFGSYYDANHQGFRDLRVINDDRVEPGQGFGSHPHRDMEILTWILEGALEHEDSMGNRSVIRAGELQRMTAGMGVRHSEFNHSDTEPVRFLQIWIQPQSLGLKPGYEQKSFDAGERTGRLALLASPEGQDGSLRVHQDVRLYASLLEEGQVVRHDLAPGRHAWLHVASGSVTLDGNILEEGDGAAMSEVRSVELETVTSGDVLLFDLR